MNDEIKRRTELTLISCLNPQFQKLQFVPAKGGSDIGDAMEIEPPFVILWAEHCEKLVSDQDIWEITGKLVYVTKMDQTTLPQHSQTVNALYQALTQIESGVDEERLLIVHGLDVSGDMEDFEDAEKQAHGDTILWTAGVSEATMPA